MKPAIACQCLMGICLVISGGRLHGASATTQATRPKPQYEYVGAAIALPDAVPRADVIVLAEVTKLGEASVDAAGEFTYDGVTLKVLESLKGAPAKELTVSLRLRADLAVREIAPQVGTRAVIFIRKSAVFKMLAADAKQVEEVKNEIKKNPVGPR